MTEISVKKNLTFQRRFRFCCGRTNERKQKIWHRIDVAYRTTQSGRFNMSERRCGMLEAFVEEVRKHSCLYDKSTGNYKDTVFKKTVWTAIAAKFQSKSGKLSIVFQFISAFGLWNCINWTRNWNTSVIHYKCNFGFCQSVLYFTPVESRLYQLVPHSVLNILKNFIKIGWIVLPKMKYLDQFLETPEISFPTNSNWWGHNISFLHNNGRESSRSHHYCLCWDFYWQSRLWGTPSNIPLNCI